MLNISGGGVWKLSRICPWCTVHDRIVEAYFLILGVYHEPKYSYARTIGRLHHFSSLPLSHPISITWVAFNNLEKTIISVENWRRWGFGGKIGWLLMVADRMRSKKGECLGGCLRWVWCSAFVAAGRLLMVAGWRCSGGYSGFSEEERDGEGEGRREGTFFLIMTINIQTNKKAPHGILNL